MSNCRSVLWLVMLVLWTTLYELLSYVLRIICSVCYAALPSPWDRIQRCTTPVCPMPLPFTRNRETYIKRILYSILVYKFQIGWRHNSHCRRVTGRVGLSLRTKCQMSGSLGSGERKCKKIFSRESSWKIGLAWFTSNWEQSDPTHIIEYTSPAEMRHFSVCLSVT